MRLCTNCNRVLKDSDTHCRYCAGETGTVPIQPIKEAKSVAKRNRQPTAVNPLNAAVPAQPATAIAHETERISEVIKETKNAAFDANSAGAFAPDTAAAHTQATLEIPFGKQSDYIGSPTQELASQPSESVVTDTRANAKEENLPDERIGPQTITVEFPFPDQQAKIEPFDENTGIIERELIVKASTVQEPHGASMNKLGVTLIAILIGLVLVCGGVLAWRYFKAPVPPDQSFYVDLLAGTWISEEFFFAENEGQNYVELLTINGDGTFEMVYLIPNNAIKDGYKDGSWEVFREVTGTYEIIVDGQSLILVYELDGVRYAFVREMMEIDIGKLVLREYYDEQMQDYSDFAFTKIS